MRRRVPPPREDDAPERLCRYDPADWPDAECHPECAYWAAVGQWQDEHPFDPDDEQNGDNNGLPVVLDGPDAPWHPEWV